MKTTKTIKNFVFVKCKNCGAQNIRIAVHCKDCKKLLK